MNDYYRFSDHDRVLIQQRAERGLPVEMVRAVLAAMMLTPSDCWEKTAFRGHSVAFVTPETKGRNRGNLYLRAGMVTDLLLVFDSDSTGATFLGWADRNLWQQFASANTLNRNVLAAPSSLLAVGEKDPSFA